MVLNRMGPIALQVLWRGRSFAEKSAINRDQLVYRVTGTLDREKKRLFQCGNPGEVGKGLDPVFQGVYHTSSEKQEN